MIVRIPASVDILVTDFGPVRMPVSVKRALAGTRMNCHGQPDRRTCMGKAFVSYMRRANAQIQKQYEAGVENFTAPEWP